MRCSCEEFGRLGAGTSNGGHPRDHVLSIASPFGDAGGGGGIGGSFLSGALQCGAWGREAWRTDSWEFSRGWRRPPKTELRRARLPLVKRTGEARWAWRIGRGRSMARMRGQREVAPSTHVEDSLDDASKYTAQYDVVTDWSDGRGTVTEKLMVASWALRYWRAGPQFRGRMVRSLAVLVAAAAASIGLVLLAR